MKEILMGLLAKTLNLSPDQVAELTQKKSDDGKFTDELLPNAVENLLAKDAERVANIKKGVDTKEAFDNGYKKAQKEVLAGLEKDLKTQYNVTDTDKTGLDLIAELVAKAAKSELPEDKVKAHPLYLSLETAKRKELEAAKAEFEAKMSEVETGFKRKETLSRVQEKARELFTGLNPILATDTAVASNQVALFLRNLEAYDYEFNDTGVLVSKDGKRVEDAQAHAIDLAKLVQTEAAKLFEFRKQEDKGNGGNGGGNGAGSGGTVKAPTSQQEYETAVFNAKDATERIAIQTAWSAAQPK